VNLEKFCPYVRSRPHRKMSLVQVATSSSTRGFLRSRTFPTDGSFRTKDGGDGGVPIDAAVDLYDGQAVNDPSA